MSGVRKGRVVKLRRGRRSSMLRMMAIMQDGNSGEVPKEFLETGRTGRRNAMPDILQAQGMAATTADLPAQLSQLATEDPPPQPCSSKEVDKKEEAPAQDS